MKTRSASDWVVHLAFGVALLAMLAMGAVSYRNVIVSSNSEQWLGHTREVLNGLEDLLFDMATVDSSSRGFALTGRESDLDPYRASASSVTRDVPTFAI